MVKETLLSASVLRQPMTLLGSRLALDSRTVTAVSVSLNSKIVPGRQPCCRRSEAGNVICPLAVIFAFIVSLKVRRKRNASIIPK